MFSKVARLSAIGMMVFFAPLTLAGCLEPEGDESAAGELATDESASDPKVFAVCSGTIPDFRIETCQSGWPGARTCTDTITSASDIVVGSIDIAISGRNGELSHGVSQSGARQINFSATVREGDVFGPGKNTTTYFLSWCRR